MKGVFLSCALALAPMAFQKPALLSGQIKIVKYLLDFEWNVPRPHKLLLVGDVEDWKAPFEAVDVETSVVGEKEMRSFDKKLYVPFYFRSLQFRVIWLLVTDGMNLMFEMDRLLIYDGFLILDIVNAAQNEEWFKFLKYEPSPVRFQNYMIYRKRSYSA